MAATIAPDRLKAARLFLLEHLGRYGLASAAVGIVGDAPHAATGSSYHLGKGQLRSDSYSIVESVRDRKGLSNAASGLDIGTFSVKAGGRTHTLRTFSAWLIEQCKTGGAGTADIREVIYSLDGQTVRRWDRLGHRTTGDSSHTSHTHISYFRDSEDRDKTGLFRRYLTEISLLEDDEMTKDDFLKLLKDGDVRKALSTAVLATDGVVGAPTGSKNADGTPNTHWAGSSYLQQIYNAAVSARTYSAEARTGVAQLAGKDLTDEQAIIKGILAGLPAAQIAAAIPTALAKQVAQELAARLAA